MAHGSSPLAVLEHPKYIEPFSLLHTGKGSLSKPGILAISILLKKIWPSPTACFPAYCQTSLLRGQAGPTTYH